MSLSKLQTQDQDLNRIQDHFLRELNPILGLEILQGKLIQDVALSGTATAVPHLLNRTYKGWIVIDKDANQDIWSPSGTNDTTRTINLQAGGAVTVSLWVF